MTPRLAWGGLLVATVASLGGARGAGAGAEEGGRWLVRAYTPWELAELGAGRLGPQFFAFEETDDGLILMGNNLGLVTFDGHRTQRLVMPEGRIVLSLNRGPEGEVWLGGTACLARLTESPLGTLALERVAPPPEVSQRPFTDVWTLGAFRWGTLFRAPELLLWRHPEGTWRAFTPAGSFGVGAARVGERWFVRDTARGLLELRQGELYPVPGGELFAAERLYALLPYGSRELLAVTRGRGLLLLDPDAPAGTAPRPLQHQLGDWPTRTWVYCGIRTSQGLYVLGSMQGGLAVINEAGELVRRLGERDGLREEQVLSLFEDSLGRIWVGHGRGVSRLGANGALTHLPLEGGFAASVEGVSRVGEQLLFATNRGVCRLSPTTPGQLEPIQGSLPAFALAPLPSGEVLVLGSSGPHVGLVNPRPLAPEILYAVAPARTRPGLWLASGQGGLYGLRVGTAGVGRLAALLVLDTDVTSFVEYGEEVWFNTEFKKPFLRRARWSRDEAAAGLPRLEEVRGWQTELEVDGHARFLVLGQRVVVAHAGEALTLRGDRLVKDRELAAALGGSAARLGRTAVPTEDGAFILSQEDRIVEVRPRGERGWSARPLAQLPPSGRILTLHREGATLWVGTDEGLFRLDLRHSFARRRLAAALREVRDSDGRVLWAMGLHRGGGTITLPRGARSLRFEAAALGAREPEYARFRLWLSPLEEKPALPSRLPFRDVAQVPGGRWTVHVEVEGGGERAHSLTTLVVPRLWHEQPLTRALAALGLVLLGALGYRGRVRALRRQAAALEAEVAARTRELREASFTDPLTGVRNRRYFYDTVNPDLQLALRGRPASGMAFFLIDLDHFKKVNDTYGHAAGDAVLRESARRLQALLRGSDLLFRWGGEEFMVLARGPDTLDGAQVAQRILTTLSGEPYPIPGGGGPLLRTASVGWAPLPFFPHAPAALTLEQLLEVADRALYRAKQEGRGRAVGYLPQDSRPDTQEAVRAWLASGAILQPPTVLDAVQHLGPRPASAEIVVVDADSGRRST